MSVESTEAQSCSVWRHATKLVLRRIEEEADICPVGNRRSALASKKSDVTQYGVCFHGRRRHSQFARCLLRRNCETLRGQATLRVPSRVRVRVHFRAAYAA